MPAGCLQDVLGKERKKREETAGWAAGLPHIKNPRRVSMRRKLKVNVAAAPATQKPTTFSRPRSSFGFTQQYHITPTKKTYIAYSEFQVAFSCN